VAVGMEENAAFPKYEPYPANGLKFTVEQRDALLTAADSLHATLSNEDTEALVKELARDDKHAQAIRAFCGSSASTLGCEALEDPLSRLLTKEQIVDMGRLFGSILPSRMASLVLAWRLSAFTSLSPQERCQVTLEWCNSRLAQVRKLGMLVKKLGILTMACSPADDARNPLFDVIGYAGKSGFRDQIMQRLPPTHDECQLLKTARIMPELESGSIELSCDCVIVGSGVGGSVAAEAISRAGYQVIMLEKAVGHGKGDLSTGEPGAYMSVYERGGLFFSTEDDNMAVVAGSAFGGGSAVNWHCSLDPSHHVRREWAQEYGVTWALGDQMADALAAVKEKLAVHTDGVEHNPANTALAEGCRKLGYHCEVAPQQGYPATPDDGGLCAFGYKGGARQGVKGSLLQDAAATGKYKFITQAFVDRVVMSDGRASGVEGNIAGRPFKVKARVVIAAAGALQSPLLLRRSGLTNQHIGKNLRLHPVSFMRGMFDKPMKLWEGAPMTMMSRVVEDLDGNGYGAKLEIPLCHPAVIAAAIPFNGDAVDFKRRAMQIDRTMLTIALTRDTGSGSVESDERGWPRVKYSLNAVDRKHLLQGLAHSARIMIAAGAKEIGWSDPKFASHFASAAGAADPSLEDFLQRLCSEGDPSKFGLFSAHQMGTCRMAGSSSQGATKPSGETWEVLDLFVSDTSTFPTASGSNPMITCAAVAHIVAQKVVERLKGNVSSRL